MTLRQKEIAYGFLVGLALHFLGVCFYILIFSKLGIGKSLEVAYKDGYLDSLLSLGAVLDLAAFFLMLKKNLDLRARGILMYTIFLALILLIGKLFFNL
jgi:hypothetical protein